jgi:hypothetical protein
LSAVGIRDVYCVLLLSLSCPVTLPEVSTLAVLTWLASTFAFHAVKVSDVVF